jgi:radical SAM protein with 4Fe4S-binding SPASM domain
MEWSLYKKIIDECSNHVVKRIYPFLFSEPLLNDELTNYIDYAKEKNPSSIVGIFTNASLLTEKKSQELLSSKIDEITISFNGIDKESYEKFMKPLKFEVVKKRIEDFIRLKKRLKPDSEFPRLSVHILKLGFNDLAIKKMVDHWNSFGVAVHTFKYENRANNVLDYDIISPKKLNKIPCNRLNQMYVLVNGDVILCCADWKAEVVLGNLKKQTIKEVWSSKKRLEYLKAHNSKNFDVKLCDICNFNEVRVD